MKKNILDIESQLRQTRKGETLFAFAGLECIPDPHEPQRVCYGMLKVTRVLFKDGSGKLCCHFLLDLEHEELRDKIGQLFQDLSHQALGMRLGQDFEYLSPVERLELGDSLWFGLTLTFSFKKKQNCSSGFMRDQFVPALERRLPVRFNDLQLWEGAEGADKEDWRRFALRMVASD